MSSFGARFNETDYIRVDMDFSSGESAVIMTTEVEGTPVTATGAITWDEVEGDGDGDGDGDGGLG